MRALGDFSTRLRPVHLAGTVCDLRLGRQASMHLCREEARVNAGCDRDGLPKFARKEGLLREAQQEQQRCEEAEVPSTRGRRGR